MASRFWVGGTGGWTPSNTTNWAATSGGAGGQSVPGSADTVTFDGNSGGGTVTLNFGGPITIQSLTTGAFTGTLDNSVNNNNITMTASGGYSGGGTGTRTIKLGSAIYTLSATNGSWAVGTTTGLTFNAGTSTIAFTGASGTMTFTGGGLTYATLSLGVTSGAGRYQINSSNTIGNVAITAPCFVEFSSATTQTISNAVNWAGSSGNQIGIVSTSNLTQATLNFAASSMMSWCSFRAIAATGSPTALSSADLGNNSGITISGPSGSPGIISG